MIKILIVNPLSLPVRSVHRILTLGGECLKEFGFTS